MGEEGFVPGAQVVQTILTVGGLDEAVARAAAMAGEAHWALDAVLGQLVALVVAEFALLVRGDHFKYMLIFYVTE